MSAGVQAIAPGVAAALFSALTQAIAHAVLKAGRDKLMVRGLIAATCAVAVLPFAFVVRPPEGWLWGWLALSSALHVGYQLVLIRAYETDDFSVAYPLARGVAPVATTVLGALFLAQTPLDPDAHGRAAGHHGAADDRVPGRGEPGRGPGGGRGGPPDRGLYGGRRPRGAPRAQGGNLHRLVLPGRGGGHGPPDPGPEGGAASRGSRGRAGARASRRGWSPCSAMARRWSR